MPSTSKVWIKMLQFTPKYFGQAWLLKLRFCSAFEFRNWKGQLFKMCYTFVIYVLCIENAEKSYRKQLWNIAHLKKNKFDIQYCFDVLTKYQLRILMFKSLNVLATSLKFSNINSQHQVNKYCMLFHTEINAHTLALLVTDYDSRINITPKSRLDRLHLFLL